MRIRTAVLGYGRSGGGMHAGAVERNPDCKMTAVCDIDPARREQTAERFGCPVYEDYREMLEKERLDLEGGHKSLTAVHVLVLITESKRPAGIP